MNHPPMLVAVGPPTWSSPRTRLAAVGLLGCAAVTVTAAAILQSPQLGCTVALVFLVVTAYAALPPAGVAALVLTWLVAPGIRRVLGLEVGYVPEDPLSVAPLVATAAVAAMVAWRIRLPRLVSVMAALVGAAMLFGLPSASGQASAALYSLASYLGAFSAVVIGWREGGSPVKRWTLLRVLSFAAPVLALYAIYQYFVELPSWDQAWLDTVDFSSIGAPEDGKIRSFASLNSPGLLGLVLAVAILFYTGREGMARWTSAALVVVAGGLSITYVRGAWLSLAVAAVVLVLASGRRAVPRVARLALLLALSATGSTYTAFFERIGTIGSLGQDDSARARTAMPAEVLPDLVGRPMGYGLGSAGEATRLSKSSGLRAPDNGYLAMAYQLGFVGALMFVGALLTALAIALRRLFARGDPDRALVAALFVFFLVALLGGDQFYGFAGVMLWYLTGAALGRSVTGRRALSTLSGA
jgi:hypothetical protein